MLSIGYMSLAALVPQEKWDAIRGLDIGRDSLFTNKWFVLTGASVIFILTIVLLAIRHLRIEQEKEVSEARFDEYADSHGLDSEEHEILAGITKRALVKRKDSIFTIMAAFNRGAVKFMQEKFVSIHNPVE
ncbi:unnamed protein product, partial [marine sediment metagenome]